MKHEGRGNPHQSPAATASPRGSQRTKKRVCAAAGWLAFLAMLGTVGGMELGTVAVGAGAAMAAALAAVWAALLYKAGWIRWRS